MKDLLARPAWAASERDGVRLLRGTQTLITQLTALQAAYAWELNGRGFPATQAATSMTTWLRDALRIPAHQARQLIALGSLMATRPALADAILEGAITTAQAAIVGDVIDDVTIDLRDTDQSTDGHAADSGQSNSGQSDPHQPDPDRPDGSGRPDPAGLRGTADLLAACEAALIKHAATLEPSALRIAGNRILAHIAPERADAILKARLDRDEARAHRTRTLTLTPIGHGQTRLSALLDAESAATLRAAIEPLARPFVGRSEYATDPAHTISRQSGPGQSEPGQAGPGQAGPGSTGPGRAGSCEAQPGPGIRDLRDLGQRRHDALIDICRLALATDTLPDNGGERPHLTVTADYDVLRGEIGAGTLDSGESVSPDTVRRMACDAQIIPAVLGTHGELLDLGRSRRLFTGPLRRAIVLRDQGCAFPGCDRPPRWCDGHHVISWLTGGPTNLANAVLLCRRHHRIIHQTDKVDVGWTVRIAGDGLPEFIPPEYIDPLRRPQRNVYHRRT